MGLPAQRLDTGQTESRCQGKGTAGVPGVGQAEGLILPPAEQMTGDSENEEEGAEQE